MVGIRRLVAAGVTALALGLPAFLAPQANAGQVRVLESCVATVRDGGQLALSPAAVQQPIADLLTPLDPLGVLVPGFRDIWAKQPPILLPGGGTVITSEAIADLVVQRLRGVSLLTPVIDALTGPVHAVLGATCGVTITPAPPAGPPPANGGTPPARSPAQPAPPAPAAPAAGNQPSAPAASPVAPLPGYAPGSGYAVGGVADVGPPEVVVSDYDSAGAPEVGVDPRALALASAAGATEGLPGDSGGGELGSPVILAALLCTLVSTQLLRVWVLRRSGADGE